MAGQHSNVDLRLLAAYLRPERARVGALTLVLLLAMVAPIAGPLLIGTALDRALDGSGDTAGLTGLAVTFLVITLLGDGLQVVVAWWSVGLAWRVGNRLRLDLARHALGLDLEWHSRHRPGLLIERLDGDIEAIVKFSSSAVLSLLGNSVLLVGTLAASLLIDWRAGLATLAATIVAIVLMVRMRPVAVAGREAEREVKAQLYGDIEERLGGLEDLKANGAGNYALHKLHQHASQWWHAARWAGLRDDGIYALGAAAFTIGTMVTLGLGVWLTRQGQLTIGATVALLRFSQMTRQPLDQIAEQLSEMHKAAAGARRAAQLLATTPRVMDGRGDALPPGPLAVELDGIGLAYANGHVALVEVDLRIEPGMVVGVVGRTGSGKTSIARLLTRLWDPTEGHVRLGGVDLCDTSDTDLRRRVAVVSQDVELLRAPLRDNLTLYGAIDASDDEIRDALAAVHLGDWAASLSHGLDTVLEDRSLSAGEAQLVSFARVLLTDPGLVVLDEATSRLDPATEARVAAATDRALAGRTGVIIAHRLATLDRVDEICVVDHGRIVEYGPRDALAADTDSRYAGLLDQAATTSRLAS
ncbi:MAG: ABC transporter ATP-binding protein [Acidimicrobiales bacterium]